jgi:hypothetical protein
MHLQVHKETVRYWYNRLLLGRGFPLKVVPNYRKLGLDCRIGKGGLTACKHVSAPV